MERDQGKRDVIAYHVRQSFKPGEITPAEANRIGYELAMRFTKGVRIPIKNTCYPIKGELNTHTLF